ncbi:MAG TPA: hypothetical protein VK625_18645 [Flavitalea sp.]|nr:hypothetical protein [Flavitalea sp.]
MTLFFILLKIIVFLAIMIIPFAGPKRKKALNQNGISTLAVDEMVIWSTLAANLRIIIWYDFSQNN